MDHAVSFLNYLEFEKRYSKRTIESYRTDLLQYHDYCIGRGITPVEVHARQIREWVVELLERGCENRSVNRKVSALKTFYKFLLRQGLIQSDPLVKVESLKIRKSLPAFVTEPQTNQLLDDIDFGDDFAGIRNKLILQLLYHTGIRRAELINLKYSDLDLKNLTLKVFGKRNKERIIPVTFELKSAIEHYLDVRTQFGLQNCSSFLLITDKGEPLYAGFVHKIVKQSLTLVTTLEKRSPHVLRHTFATHLLNNGAEISAIKELLGHTSLAATQVYTHNTFEKLKSIYKQAHPRA